MAAEPAKLTPEVLAAVERLRQDGNFAFRRGKHAAAIEARANSALAHPRSQHTS